MKRRTTSTFTFARPADTDAYTSGDVISNATGSTHAVMTFTGAASLKGLGGLIRSVTIVKSATGTTNLDFDLFLFDTAPAAMEDNAAFDPTDAEMKRLIGFVEFLAADVAVGSVNVAWTKSNLDLVYNADPDATSIYGILVIRGAWTPGSGEEITVRLGLEVD